MTLASLLAVLTLFVAVPLNWWAVAKLWNLYRATPVDDRGVIRDRVIAALAVAVIVTVFALVFANNDLAHPVLTGDATKLVTRVALLAGGIIPAAYWLWSYR